MLDQTFAELPDANKINFIDAPGVPLSTLLPHSKGSRLYEKQAHFPPADPEPTALDLIHRLLVYPPESRFRAADALRHAWLLDDPPLVLPQAALASDVVPACAAEVRDGRTAGEWLRAFLTSSPRQRREAVDD
jgi:cyclin-dependent kinase 8/11